MAAITLNYDARNVQAKKALDLMTSIGLFQIAKKTGLEEAFEDIVNGRVKRLITPKKQKA